MTNETILPELIGKLAELPEHIQKTIRAYGRAYGAVCYRQALESDRVQAWKRDSERLDWLESSEDSHGFCHAGYGDYIYYAHQEEGYPSVREVIDAAVEQQK